ncbi:MAG: aminoacyl-tRNA hydrolase [Nitrospinae bacterium]|nr:aminoacyl-tRNA hydrolase [Nitrospinota bacterium]
MRGKLIAGLGNPGPRYSLTRHNAGFLFADRLLDRFGEGAGDDLDGSPLVTLIDRPHVHLITPLSYMNLSGPPVADALRLLRLTVDDLLVVHDDIDIPVGDVRYKEGGGHGGHNGLKSLFESLGSPAFSRIRIGVGRPAPGVAVVDHVLGTFTPAEVDPIDEALDRAVELAGQWIS